MHAENPPARPHSRVSIALASAALLLGVLPVHADDPFQLSVGELVTTSDLVVSAELAPAGDMLEVRPTEVLKGAVPGNFKIRGKGVFRREEQTGIYRDEPSHDDDVLLDKDASKNKRIIFLWKRERYNIECLQPEAMKPRVLEVMAMDKDPAPFVHSGKHDEDRDLIFLLGERFRAFRIEGVQDRSAFFQTSRTPEEMRKEDLVYNLLPEYDVPWERVHLTIPLTYDPDRKSPLMTDGFDGQGAIAGFIREKIHQDDPGSKEAKQPSRFTVTLDTRGPEKVGELTRTEASAFLVKQLRSKDEAVVRTTLEALKKMRDCDAVTAAIGMLGEGPAIHSRAMQFLWQARDPDLLEKLGAAMDALPEIPDGGHDMENTEARVLAEMLPEGPEKLPVLRRAMKKGYAGIKITSTVAEQGSAGDFELLLSPLRDPAAVPQTTPLSTMVKRSNQKTEEWMKDLGTGESQGQDTLRQQWLTWWEANKNDFKITD